MPSSCYTPPAPVRHPLQRPGACSNSASSALLRRARQSVTWRTRPVYADAASRGYGGRFRSTGGGRCRAMNTTRTAAPRRQPAYDEHARSYERDTAAFQPHRCAVVEALPLHSGQVVLDVGCGTGLCCGLLRDKVGPRGGVVGIEESPDMAAVAREHIV